ncbi:MAG TPA: hypothetical protein VE046_01205 [Steroidobacteraceae bacterium]|nr:hypothetical protein [Steroidobacteraceae bacterium]
MKPILLAGLALYSLAACATAPSPGLGAATQATATPAEPAVDSMKLARPTSKISVPADVRYQLSSAALKDQPITVAIAVVPRVAGENLRIEFPASDSVVLESGASASVQEKATAAAVYRRSLIVTPRSSEVAEMRVLVSMDVEGGRYFGVFSIPLGRKSIDKNAPVHNQ